MSGVRVVIAENNIVTFSVAVVTAIEDSGMKIGSIIIVPEESEDKQKFIIGDEIRAAAMEDAQRAANAGHPPAHFYIGGGQGYVCRHSDWFQAACIAVHSPDIKSVAFSAYHPIPTEVANRMLVDRREHTRIGSKSRRRGDKDSVERLVPGAIRFDELIPHAVRCALVPHLSRELCEVH